MKGTIFTALGEMVEQEFGLRTWDAVLHSSRSDGLFVATETYKDEEFHNLVFALHAETGIPVASLQRSFGEYAFPMLAASAPALVSKAMHFKDFLLTVDRVIHVEVRKLHPDASLPKFEYEDEKENELTMHYSSKRQLCMFSEGLISGAARHFNARYTLKHSQCMHEGYHSCVFELSFADSAKTH